MWTRKQLKERGSKAFKANYWKCVLVALIFAVVAGGFSAGNSVGGGSFPAAGGMTASSDGTDVNVDTDGVKVDADDVKVDADKDKVKVSVNDEEDGKVDVDVDTKTGKTQVKVDGKDIEVGDGGFVINGSDKLAKGAIVAAVIAGLIVGIVVFTCIMAFAFAISAFLLNPIEMGCSRFFYRNLDEPASVKDVVFAFDNHYINIVKTLFFRDLYLFFWGMLFVIPGIIKSYEYRMLPFILQDDPTISKDEAFALSRQMMSGNKWKAFVLDLSFIGWHILSLFTCGLLGIFYVRPYQDSTNAALYEALKSGNTVSGEEVVYEA